MNNRQNSNDNLAFFRKLVRFFKHKHVKRLLLLAALALTGYKLNKWYQGFVPLSTFIDMASSKQIAQVGVHACVCYFL